MSLTPLGRRIASAMIRRFVLVFTIVMFALTCGGCAFIGPLIAWFLANATAIAQVVAAVVSMATGVVQLVQAFHDSSSSDALDLGAGSTALSLDEREGYGDQDTLHGGVGSIFDLLLGLPIGTVAASNLGASGVMGLGLLFLLSQKKGGPDVGSESAAFV